MGSYGLVGLDSVHLVWSNGQNIFSILFDFANDTRKIAQVFPLMRPHSIAPPAEEENIKSTKNSVHQEAMATPPTPDATVRRQSAESRNGSGASKKRKFTTSAAQTQPESRDFKEVQPTIEQFPTIQQAAAEVAGLEKKPVRAREIVTSDAR